MFILFQTLLDTSYSLTFPSPFFSVMASGEAGKSVKLEDVEQGTSRVPMSGMFK